jgi:hypothetical protein
VCVFALVRSLCFCFCIFCFFFFPPLFKLRFFFSFSRPEVSKEPIQITSSRGWDSESRYKFRKLKKSKSTTQINKSRNAKLFFSTKHSHMRNFIVCSRVLVEMVPLFIFFMQGEYHIVGHQRFSLERQTKRTQVRHSGTPVSS